MPDSLNPRLTPRRTTLPDVEALWRGIRAQDRAILGQAITLIESTRLTDQPLAEALLNRSLEQTQDTIRVGITGTPGVGKSTFIETLGLQLIEQGHRVAVLAVDPTSQISGGSILGDKTRMPRLSTHERAFVRPTAAGDSLGGVAQRTRESILLCEAAGYDIILVETVGVGQSETTVHDMVDFFLLLLLPGAGDELQGIKRGIVEMADLIAINKADEGREAMARQARLDYQRALHLFPPKANGWTPQVFTAAGLSGEGVKNIWASVEKYRHQTRQSGYFLDQRSEQAVYWFRSGIRQGLERNFLRREGIQQRKQELETQVRAGKISSFRAVAQLLDQFHST